MRKMKDSGIEWIGEIPESWEITRHKYVMHKEKNICEHYNGEDIISLTMGGVIVRDLDAGGKMPTTFDGYQFVEPNKLLLCLFDIDVTPRCVGVIRNKGITSPAYSKFVVHDGYSVEYYNYLLRAIDDDKVLVHLAKNLRSSFTETDFGALPTVVPPLSEQTAIASYLDTQCAHIDSVIEKTKQSIEEYKKLKQAVITQAVTKGVRGEREMKDSGVEWIGEIPREWEVSKLKRCAVFSPKCDTSQLTDDTIVEYLPMEYVKKGTYTPNTEKYSNISNSLTPFQNGDIIFAKVTPCFENGNIAILQNISSGIGFGSSELYVIRTESIDTSYMFYWLQNIGFVNAACATMTGTGGLKRVSSDFVKNSPIAFPPIHEQSEIATYLDQKCAEIDTLITKKEQFLTELESYKKSMIYEYVTGKKEVPQ